MSRRDAMRWALSRIGVERAQSMGALGAGIHVRVVDTALPIQSNGRPAQPSLHDSGQKFMGVTNGQGARSVDDSAPGAHGLQVAAIVCARDDLDKPWATGLDGVAPAAQWSGVLLDGVDNAEQLRRALGPTAKNLPNVDVVVMCLGLSEEDRASVTTELLEQAAFEGRRRRGQMLFVSVGNGADEGRDPIGLREFPFMIACGAVDATPKGSKWPPRGGALTTPYMDFCAPVYSQALDRQVATVSRRPGVGLVAGDETALQALHVEHIAEALSVRGSGSRPLTRIVLGPSVKSFAVRDMRCEISETGSNRRWVKRIYRVAEDAIELDDHLEINGPAIVRFPVRVLTSSARSTHFDLPRDAVPARPIMWVVLVDGLTQRHPVEWLGPATDAVLVPAGEAYLCEMVGSIEEVGGTSSATPLCAGVAALLMGMCPQRNLLEIRAAMWRTGEPVAALGAYDERANLAGRASKFGAKMLEELPRHDPRVGFGVVQADAALEALKKTRWPDHRIMRIEIERGDPWPVARVTVASAGSATLHGTHVRVFLVLLPDDVEDPELPTAREAAEDPKRLKLYPAVRLLGQITIELVGAPVQDPEGMRWRVIAEVVPHDGDVGDGLTVGSSGGNAAQAFLFGARD